MPTVEMMNKQRCQICATDCSNLKGENEHKPKQKIINILIWLFKGTNKVIENYRNAFRSLLEIGRNQSEKPGGNDLTQANPQITVLTGERAK